MEIVKMAPYGAAALGFNMTLVAWQGAGKMVGISCATPIAGPFLGGLAVASASIVAAQLGNVVEALIYKKKIKFLSKDTLVFHAAFGAVVFKALGGRYRNVMPSNVSYPGALARASLPARGSRYASDTESQVIKEMFDKYGCHHCGSSKGISIADHMPPNVVVKGRVADSVIQRRKKYLYGSIVDMVCGVIRRMRRIELQRFYPQCQECMKKQSAALRHAKTKLVFHYKPGFPEPPQLTGFFVSAVKMDNIDNDDDDTIATS